MLKGDRFVSKGPKSRTWVGYQVAMLQFGASINEDDCVLFAESNGTCFNHRTDN